jgi:hypothetical protein
MGSRFGTWPNEICSIRELRTLGNSYVEHAIYVKAVLQANRGLCRGV